MLTLYINPTCPYCIKTLTVARELSIPLTIKNKNDAGIIEEVVRLGGVQQFPFLTDSESDVKLYESDDIIAYLKRHTKTD